ncbi:hypothetical protein Unana1_05030 [Umbelopsis nana]
MNNFIKVLLLSSFVYASNSDIYGKCTYRDSCWPNASVWKDLNNTMDGRLVTPIQPAYYCHDPHFDKDACDKMYQNNQDMQWATDQSGALVDQKWLADPSMPFEQTCAFNVSRNLSCPQGNIPVYALDVRTVRDIQYAVKFASKYNLRLVIRNTGHDFAGRSTATGAFSIWTHHLNSVEVVDSFVQDRCFHLSPTHAVTVQAGAQWDKVYDTVGAVNRTVVGGSQGSVGAAGGKKDSSTRHPLNTLTQLFICLNQGYVAGGGHSTLSPTFGLAADNVLQFSVVTANGELVTANDCQNTDLFWAMRGGGGSTYGVIYNVTYKTHEERPVVGISLTALLNNFNSWDAVVRSLNEIQPKLSDEGFSGNFQILPGNAFSLATCYSGETI